MKKLNAKTLILTSLLTLFLVGCQAVETSQSLQPREVAQAKSNYYGPKYKLVVGAFDNRSAYNRGIFSNGEDRLGHQSKTILKTHLQMTNRFVVLDRDNMATLQQESEYGNQKQSIKGAEIAITGDVVEFGRKVTGDQQLFGILGSGKTQTAYSKVALNVVNTRTSEVLYSVQGAGEYQLKNREVAGFGSTAGYDATLNGKVLSLAIIEAVNRLVEGLEQGHWSLQE